MKHHPNYYIMAYLCRNLGDDLLVLSLLRRYPDVLFYLCVSPEESRAFEKEKNAITPTKIEWYMLRLYHKLFHRDELSIINYRFLNKCQAVIKIGGSIFIESENFNWKTFIPQKTHVIGANFEHDSSPQFYEKVRIKLSQIASCTFRDLYSYNLFCNLDNVSVAPDAVFSLDFHREKKRGKGIAISVICPERRTRLKNYSEYYYQIIAEVVDYCELKKIPVALFGFCSYEKDDVAIEKIRTLVKTSVYPEVCVYDGDTDSFLDRLNSYESIIATRFHAMIIGWKLAKRVLPVIYSEKQVNVLNDIEYNGFSWNLLNRTPISGKELVEEALISSLMDRTDQLAIMAQGQFSLFDSLTRSDG